MNQSNTNLSNPSAKKIAYIQAGWHQNIVGNALATFKDGVAKGGIKDAQIDVFDVPGSLEIPLQSKLIAQTGKYDIIVACGFVVNGGIYRHDFVASTVIDAMMDVQLETQIPILSVVLTPINFHEHEAHQGFFEEHFKIKGEEAADACLQTLANLENLSDMAKAA